MKALEFVTFAILRYGRMAERLRQRSAKPSTPVRIRFRPPKKEAFQYKFWFGSLPFFFAFSGVLTKIDSREIDLSYKIKSSKTCEKPLMLVCILLYNLRLAVSLK